MSTPPRGGGGWLSSPSSAPSPSKQPAAAPAARPSSWAILRNPPFFSSLFANRNPPSSSNISSPTNSATVPASNVTTNPARKSKITFEDDDEEEENDDDSVVVCEKVVLQPQISLQDEDGSLSPISNTRVVVQPLQNRHNNTRNNSMEPAGSTTDTAIEQQAVAVASNTNNAGTNTERTNEDDNDHVVTVTKRRRISVEPMLNVYPLMGGDHHPEMIMTTTTSLVLPPQQEVVEVQDSSVSSMSTAASHSKRNDHVLPQDDNVEEEEHHRRASTEVHSNSSGIKPIKQVAPPLSNARAVSDDAALSAVCEDPMELQQGDDNDSVVSVSSATGSATTESQPEIPPSMDALKYQCWKCSVPFRQEGGAFCFYAMHVHPVLQVPICFVCSRHVVEAAATNTAVPVKKDETKNHDQVKCGSKTDKGEEDQDSGCCCMGCGDDEEAVDVLLCCDNCPATFCDLCVAKAHGGGQEGLQTAQELQQSDEEWFCPKCRPPPPLHQLQEFVQGMSEPGETNGTKNSPSSRTREQVLDEYMKVEHERELVDWYLSPEQWSRKQKEVRKELESKRKRGPHRSDDDENDLEEEIETEMQLWERQLQDHDARLQDMAASLQDEMGAMNVPIPYLAIPELENKADDEEAKEPTWKRQADLECEQRKKQTEREARKKPPPRTYHDEAWDDVEDLKTSELDDGDEGAEEELERSQWRSQGRVRKEDLDIATRCEDEQLKQRNIAIKHCISDDQDVQNILKEDQQTSAPGAEGIARVRRDDFQLFQGTTQKQQRKQPATKPKKPTPTETKVVPKTEAADSSQTTTSNAEKSPNRIWRLVPTPKLSIKRKLEPAVSVKSEHNQPPAKRRLMPSLVIDGDDDDNSDSGPIVDATDECSVHEESVPAAAVAVNKPPSCEDEKASNASVPSNQKTTLAQASRCKKVRKSVGSGTSSSPVLLEDDDGDDASFIDDDDSLSPSSDTKDIFGGSTLILTPHDAKGRKKKRRAAANRQSVTIAEPIARKLKPHQKDGIQFMWNNTFSDLVAKEGDATDVSGGCILAHNMGLGKTLTCIALLHCILNHPVLTSTAVVEGKRKVRTVLIVVPVNTMANWEAEFEMWTGNLHPSIRVINLGSVDVSGRGRNIRRWMAKGGVLLISDKTFLRASKDFHEDLVSPGPDVIVLDEAHVMVKNAETGIFKALSKVETTRRIALTGSPVQNNLLEYYRMVSWVRPGILGTVAEFDEGYIAPINRGLPSDAPQEAIGISNEKSLQLNELLAPCVQRRDASVLNDEIPPMQQVVLHVRPSKLQTQFYRAAKQFPNRNFFKLFQALKPIHNHPGCLLMNPSGQTVAKDSMKRKRSGGGQDSDLKAGGEKMIESSEQQCDAANPGSSENLDLDESYVPNQLPAKSQEKEAAWWLKIAERFGLENMKDLKHGHKIVLFLHILVLAYRNGEKVMLFTKCCKTLDFIEEVLNLEDWGSQIESLRTELGSDKMGQWRKNVDYLRIDGQVSSGERGELVAKFNDVNQSADHAKLFLISKAGGIGVNLVAASRVILFDCDFNPTVNMQALFRCYRYGQTKPVFAYLFLTEGSMEEKIYSRCVTKTGMALRVVDRKTIERCFSARELQDLAAQDLWIECTRCRKWRMLPPDDTTSKEDVPEDWCCEMLQGDDVNNNCDASEKEQAWYFQNRKTHGDDNVQQASDQVESGNELPDFKKAALVTRDIILQKILHLSAADCGKSSPNKGKSTWNKRKATGGSTGKSLLISKYYFHEKLLEDSGITDKVLKSETGGLGQDVPVTDLTITSPSKATPSKEKRDQKSKTSPKKPPKAPVTAEKADVGSRNVQKPPETEHAKDAVEPDDKNDGEKISPKKAKTSKPSKKSAMLAARNSVATTVGVNNGVVDKHSAVTESTTCPDKIVKARVDADQPELVSRKIDKRAEAANTKPVLSTDSNDTTHDESDSAKQSNTSKSGKKSTTEPAPRNSVVNAKRVQNGDKENGNPVMSDELMTSTLTSSNARVGADQPTPINRNIPIPTETAHAKSLHVLASNVVPEIGNAAKKESTNKTGKSAAKPAPLKSETTSKDVTNISMATGNSFTATKEPLVSGVKTESKGYLKNGRKVYRSRPTPSVDTDEGGSRSTDEKAAGTEDHVLVGSLTSGKEAAPSKVGAVPSGSNEVSAETAKSHRRRQATVPTTKPKERGTHLSEAPLITRPVVDIIDLLDSDEEIYV